MGWPMAAAMGASALGGMMGGKGQAEAANRPTTTSSQNTAWRPGQANRWAEGYENMYNNAQQNVNFGPRGYQSAMFQDLMGSTFGGGRRRGGGGGGGGGGIAGGGGRGGGGGGGIFQRLAGNNVAFNPYEERVLGADFMNMENNPIIQERLAALRGENQESLRQSLGEAMGQFVGGGGTMGISGMMAAGRGKMSDDFGENLGQQQAGFLADYDAQMRAQQAAANQAWSGRESAYDSSGFQNDATKAAANIAAAAQRYSADQQLRGVRAGISSQDAQARFAQQMAVFGLGSQMAGMQQQGEGLGALGLAHDYGQSMLPYQQAFGSSQSTSQGPQVSPFNAAVSGGLAGAGFGNQLGTQFGFQPFGQGGGKG